MTKAETELCYQWSQRNRAYTAYRDDREYKLLVLRFWNVLIRDLIREVRAERKASL